MGITWAEVTCKTPSEMVEQLSDFLVSLSGNGVCIENLDLDTFSIEALPDAPVKMVKSYFIADESLKEKIDAISAYMDDHISPSTGFVPAQPTIAFIQEEDWANNWKKHFKPARVGKRIVIKPTWENIEAAVDDVILELDPGMAFGTGSHPTSRLCIETLERIFSAEAPFNGNSLERAPEILDVGTGSGILAIAAAKLGAGHVTAIDIDPKAINIAEQNTDLNGVKEAVTVSTTPLKEVSGSFQVVVANILAEDLIRMAEDLVGKMSVDGFLILSGILSEKEETVLNGFASLPLSHVETTGEGEWICITFRRQR